MTRAAIIAAAVAKVGEIPSPVTLMAMDLFEGARDELLCQHDWADPSQLGNALATLLAAKLCIPTGGSVERANALFRLAATELRLAKLLDSQVPRPDRHGHTTGAGDVLTPEQRRAA